MKRIYIVTVGAGSGHEYADSHSEMELHGPFTKETAEKLAAKLNEILDDPEDGEHPVASVEVLDSRTPADILREYRHQRSLERGE